MLILTHLLICNELHYKSIPKKSLIESGIPPTLRILIIRMTENIEPEAKTVAWLRWAELNGKWEPFRQIIHFIVVSASHSPIYIIQSPEMFNEFLPL